MDMDDVEALDLTALGGTDDDGERHVGHRLPSRTSTCPGRPVGRTARGHGQRVGPQRRHRRHGGGIGIEVTGLKTTTAIAGSETADRLVIDGQAGNDTIDVDPAVNALITVVATPDHPADRPGGQVMGGRRRRGSRQGPVVATLRSVEQTVGAGPVVDDLVGVHGDVAPRQVEALTVDLEGGQLVPPLAELGRSTTCSRISGRALSSCASSVSFGWPISESPRFPRRRHLQSTQESLPHG